MTFPTFVWSGIIALACLPAAAGANRVVSQTVGGDEMLLALAEPGEIAALSHIAHDPAFSAVAAEAARYPTLQWADDAEGILKFRPTLVLFADYSRIELMEQVRRAGVRVLVFDRYHTLEDAYFSLRQLAHELGPGAEARADHIVRKCEASVEELARRLAGVRPVRVIAPSTYGLIPGVDTTFQDLCDHAGAENLAATLGGLHGHQPPPDEQMLTWPVEKVVVAGDAKESALAVFRDLPPYSLMPAIREGRAVLLDPWQLSCVSHYRIQGYEKLARALHPGRFAE